MEFYLGEIFKYPSIGKLLDYIIKTDTTFYEAEAAKETGLTNKTVSNGLEYLEKLRIIRKERKIGMTQLYLLNWDHVNQNIRGVYSSYKTEITRRKEKLKNESKESNNTRISSRDTKDVTI